MTFHRDINSDRKLTERLIQSGRNAPFREPSWLDHKGKGAILDYELLKGATKGQLVLRSGRKMSAVNAHIYHLKREHGLEITVNQEKYLIDIPYKGFKQSDNDVSIGFMSNPKSEPDFQNKKDDFALSKEDSLKVGQLVKNYIPDIFNYCRSKDSNEFVRIMNKDYSKRVFNINFSFCKRVSEISDEEEVRYWKNEFPVDKTTLRVCSQWYKESKPLFLAYLHSKNIISEDEYRSFKNFDSNQSNVRTVKLEPSVERPKLKDIDLATPIINKMAEPLPSQQEINSPFDNNLDKEASRMSEHYKSFYLLERSIRSLIVEVMEEKYGKLWWEQKVDYRVKENVKRNLEYELDTPHSKRSEHNIDYSTFGDLRKIINTSWNDFQPKFKRNLSSVNEILIDLNRIRVPIAHCTPLPKREVKRLEVRIEDWFDLLK